MSDYTDAAEEFADTLSDVAESGEAECRLCGHTVQGDSFGEILEKMGEHGEEAHEYTDEGWVK